MLGIASAVYQPAKAQVGVGVNIGTPAYYAPRSYNAYYVHQHVLLHTLIGMQITIVTIIITQKEMW